GWVHGAAPPSPPAGVRRAESSARSVPWGSGRTDPSPNTNWATPGWAEPQFSLYGAPAPSGTMPRPPRDVPFEPPRKNGSSQYHVCGRCTCGSNAFSPTRTVLEGPSVKAVRLLHLRRLSDADPVTA